MKTNKLVVFAATIGCGTLLGGVTPVVSNVTMMQDNGRRVAITYELDAPAVVTLDVETNAADGVWASIGGAAVCNAQGDVWKKVAAGSRAITWRPDLSWPDHVIPEGGARAVLTAWALDNTPDYMVVDISSGARPDTQTYYPAADFLPGGLLENDDYRLTKIVMRKIMAKDVPWTMGSVSESGRQTNGREATHTVTLTNNYYMGVFEITQTQWTQVAGYNNSYFTFQNMMRPVDGVCYNEIRCTKDDNGVLGGLWPAEPYGESFLGILRNRTGIDFDLPSEAQWEFAARAGHGEGCWGDGSLYRSDTTCANLSRLGRYKTNGGYVNGTKEPAPNCGVTNGPAVVGSYLPNDWGLYDMNGNVWEWCLDWFETDITSYDGKVNVKFDTPSATLTGEAGTNRVMRGGGWSSAAGSCRAALRSLQDPSARKRYVFGMRVVCTAGLD